MTISVLLVDDHLLVRKGFRMILEAQPDLSVAGEAGNGVEAVAASRDLLPNVVLMDIHMPELDGVQATKLITQATPRVRVLAVSTFDLDEYVVSALRAGAAGFLPKDVSPEELVEAVRVVHRGESAVAPRLLTRLIGSFVRVPERRGAAMPPEVARLTDREREILVLIARGRSNTEIADELHLAGSTIKSHVSSLFAKVGVQNRAQAVIVAYEAGLVVPGG